MATVLLFFSRLPDLIIWRELVPGVNWNEMLAQPGNKESAAMLCLNTHTGPGRRLRPLPVGRPEYKRQTKSGENRWPSPIIPIIPIILARESFS